MYRKELYKALKRVAENEDIESLIQKRTKVNWEGSLEFLAEMLSKDKVGELLSEISKEYFTLLKEEFKKTGKLKNLSTLRDLGFTYKIASDLKLSYDQVPSHLSEEAFFLITGPTFFVGFNLEIQNYLIYLGTKRKELLNTLLREEKGNNIYFSPTKWLYWLETGKDIES